MKRRLEDLFSVERLRRHWDGQGTSAPAEAAPEQPVPASRPLPAREAADELRRMVHQRFSAARGAPLDALLDALDHVLDRIVPPGADSTPDQEMLEEFKPVLNGLFDDLEDMIEALELGEPR